MIFSSKFIIIAVLFFSVEYYVNGQQDQNYLQNSLIVDHCDKLYSLACFKLDAANWFDRFGVNSEFNIIPGVSMFLNSNSVKMYTSSEIAAEVAREFPNDENARVDQFLAKKIKAFLSNHTLKLNLWDAIYKDAEVSGRKDKEKKGDGGMGMILVAGAMVIGLLTALAMGGLAALAGKALLTGLVSFVISGIIGLKQLTSSKEKTYIAQPVPVYTSASPEGWEEYAGKSRKAQ